MIIQKSSQNEWWELPEVFSRASLSEKWAKSAQYRLIDENETRLFGLRRLDQRFLKLKVRSKCNLVQSQVFSEKLKTTLNAYHNRAISTAQVIEELIALAKELDAATKRIEALGLTDDEVAFYNALAANDSAAAAMGDDKLKLIAAELITQVKKSLSIDWTLRESARARIRVMVKRILNKYGYPPDLQNVAVKTVLTQAELPCAAWV
ncbi:type I restriction enzyme endonuclease domain-containing protein [Synechococcus sp. CCFWC 502]|uniref:type I restriction enzyme endonuclease domain-containing protein n=1 Tax=unclassified Synechococcus TaxID=2626047 RepID=UPI00345D3671